MNTAPENAAPITLSFGPLGNALGPRAHVIPAGVAVAGILVFLLGVGLLLLHFRTVSRLVQTFGTVVRVEHPNGRPISYVQFYTREGFSEVVPTAGDHEVGTSIRLYYDPANVSLVLFRSFSSIWVVPGLIMLFGVVFAALAAAAALRNFQRYKLFSYLRESGRKVSGKVVRVINQREATRAAVRQGRGTHTAQQKLGWNFLAGDFYVVCTWYNAANDTTLEFCSEPLRSPPFPDPTGGVINIYVSGGDTKVYYVDLYSMKPAEPSQ